MLRYSISILLLLASLCSFAQDTLEDEAPERNNVKDSTSQLRLNIDVAKILANQLQSERTTYAVEIDYYWKKDVYFVAEGGFGKANLTYADLAYESSNVFFKAGLNKSLLPRMTSRDWDMAFIGLRYGVGFIDRGDAFYSITDSVWGTTTGIVPGASLTAHWLELTGGVRVELFKQFFVGWNARGKFLLNGSSFKELPPYNIAGYGRGEKSTIFDFNVYLGYAIRWDRKNVK